MYDDFDAAVADGVIVPPGRVTEGATAARITYSLAEVRRDSLVRSGELSVSAEFSKIHLVRFEHYGGLYSGAINVSVGSRVVAGDLLARQVFQDNVTEPMGINYHRLVFERELFEERFSSEYTRRSLEIEDYLRAAMFADESELEILLLRLDILELQFERFMLASERTRRDLRVRMDEIETILNGEELLSPASGVVTSIAARNEGFVVPNGYMFFAIADENYVRFAVQGLTEVVRFGNTFTIRGPRDGFEFEARVVVDPFAPGAPQAIRVFYLMPADGEAFETMLESLGLSLYELVGMNFSLVFHETLVSNALILSADAVRQEDLAEYVLIYEDGRLLKRYITRGLQFQNYVQVLMGVEEGQRVALR